MPPADRPPVGLATLVASEVPPSRGDRLAALQALAARLRDLRMEQAVAQEQLAEVTRTIGSIEGREMPDLMAAAGVDSVGVPAAGNLPGVDYRLSRYVHAVIGSEWDPERRARAFHELEKQGAGDLVQHMVAVRFRREEHERAQKLADKLREAGYEVTVERSVHWATLTSWVRRKLEEGAELPMEELGASSGWVVKAKDRE